MIDLWERPVRNWIQADSSRCFTIPASFTGNPSFTNTKPTSQLSLFLLLKRKSEALPTDHQLLRKWTKKKLEIWSTVPQRNSSAKRKSEVHARRSHLLLGLRLDGPSLSACHGRLRRRHPLGGLAELDATGLFHADGGVCARSGEASLGGKTRWF